MSHDAARHDTPSDDQDQLLAEQIAYYRARAPEYEAGADELLGLGGGEELRRALDAFRPEGHVLELACGIGWWTERLLQGAESVTALDAAPEMLARAAARIRDNPRVRFVEADLFRWQPDRRYDVVFFGFWLSHVPLERFKAFWSLVADCVAPGGRVFFADDAYRTSDELIEGRSSPVIQRRLLDGTPFRAVKVPHTSEALEELLRELGWDIEVHRTSGAFFWGAGQRA